MSRLFDMFERLIAFPTVSRDGNLALVHYCSALLAEAGIASRLFVEERGDRASLFATVGPDVPGGVVLSGHTDVVPVEGQAWTTDPFALTERDGRFYGRGAADMKAYIACALDAMLAASARRLSKPLHLALSYDEEIGCVGVRPMLAELAKAGLKPEWVMIGEPTNMQIATGHKGKLGARAICCGVAAHSALSPTGLNAIHLASDFLSVIRAKQAEFSDIGEKDTAYDVPYTTLHAGIIKGGTALNIVPDRCDLDFEIRNIAGDDAGQILNILIDEANVLRDRARQHFPSADIRIEIFNEYPGLETGLNLPVVQKAHVLSANPRPIKVAFGTEGGLFQKALNVPVIVCGPGSMEQGHKPDEYLEKSQVLACQSMLYRILETLV